MSDTVEVDVYYAVRNRMGDFLNFKKSDVKMAVNKNFMPRKDDTVRFEGKSWNIGRIEFKLDGSFVVVLSGEMKHNVETDE